MNYRFIHTADIHSDADPIKQQKLEASLGQMVDYCKEVKVNAIIIAGDIWEERQNHSDNSGVPLIYTYLRHLSKLVDFIFIVKGNNSHDQPGSISLLHQLEPNIYAFEKPVTLSVDTFADAPVINLLDPLLLNSTFHSDYIVSLIPYPSKSMFIVDDSIENNNEVFLQMFEQVFELIGDVTSKYECPKLLGFHGNVQGSRLSSGQTLTSKDILVAPSTLDKAKADYYALGHIHLRQEIRPNMIYSGSLFNKNWGETESKSFEVIEFIATPFDGDSHLECNERIMLTSARPMVKLEATFDQELGFITKPWTDGETYDLPKGAEIRYRVTIKEEDKILITDDKLQVLKELFGDDVKIEFNEIPKDRDSRSEAIMNCVDLLDETKEFARVNIEEFTPGMEDKYYKIQELAV